jgi:hypothetical protein
MALKLPKSTRALVLRESPIVKPQTYNDAKLEERPIRALKAGELLVKMRAVSFNHKDVCHSFHRVNIYYSWTFCYCSYGYGLGSTLESRLEAHWELMA